MEPYELNGKTFDLLVRYLQESYYLNDRETSLNSIYDAISEAQLPGTEPEGIITDETKLYIWLSDWYGMPDSA